MGVKVAVAQKAEGLADVVQQRRPAHGKGRIVHAFEAVFEHVVCVEVGALCHAVACGEFGKQFAQDARRAQDAKTAVGALGAARLPIGAEQAVQLGVDALGGDVADERAISGRARKAFFVGRKTRLRGKARKTREPQSVLAEHLFRRRHRAQTPVPDVGNAPQRIAECVRADLIIDGVGTEIAAACVANHVLRKFDLGGRVQAAHIFVRAESGKFKPRALFVRQLDRPRIAVDGGHAHSAYGGGAFHLRLGGGGADVPIGGRRKHPAR